MANMARAYFSGAFLAESIDVGIPADCPDPCAFMREWIANGHGGCQWFYFGTNFDGTTSYADGTSKRTSKQVLEDKCYFIGGKAIPRADLTGTLKDNIECNYPDAIGGIICRNGWGQPLHAEDEIWEAPQ